MFAVTATVAHVNAIELHLSPTIVTSFWHTVFALLHIPVIWRLTRLGWRGHPVLQPPFVHWTLVLFLIGSFASQLWLSYTAGTDMGWVVFHWLVRVRALCALPFLFLLTHPPSDGRIEEDSSSTQQELERYRHQCKTLEEKYEARLRALSGIARLLSVRCNTLEAKWNAVQGLESVRTEFDELKDSLADMQRQLVLATNRD